MQSAMIANLRQRIVKVEFVGITLNPEETHRRHGINSFPLAAVSRPYYDLINSNNPKSPDRQTVKLSRSKAWLKEIPGFRGSWRALRACRMELAHMCAAAGVVRKLDGLIIPGGGALDDFWGGPWGQPWALFKWSILSRAFGVPFLFVSIGKCSLERPLSRFFARVALRFATYRSYRDPESKVAAQALVDVRKDLVYPDLAFSYPSSKIPMSRGADSRDARLVIGVSPIAYCDPRAWPVKERHRYSEYVRHIADIVTWLVKERYRVLFFTTDAPDSATVADIQSILPSSTMDAGFVQTLASSADQSLDSLLQEISAADLTIASRLHGVILSHLNNTPVLALSFDRKVDAHMHAVGQENYCLNIDHLHLDTVIERFNALKAGRQREQRHLHSAAQRFHRLLDLQYDRILGTPRSGPMTGDDQNHIDAGTLAEIGGFQTR